GPGGRCPPASKRVVYRKARSALRVEVPLDSDVTASPGISPRLLVRPDQPVVPALEGSLAAVHRHVRGIGKAVPAGKEGYDLVKDVLATPPRFKPQRLSYTSRLDCTCSRGGHASAT